MPKQKTKSTKLHWKELPLVGKGPYGEEIRLTIWYLFNEEGTYRAFVQQQYDDSWKVAVGRPSVTLSDICASVDEAKRLAEDTLKEWGL